MRVKEMFTLCRVLCSLNVNISFSVYIPVNATQGNDLVRLFAMVGSNAVTPTPIFGDSYGIVANYTWNIKITQIDCSSNNILQGTLLDWISYCKLIP